MENKIIYMFAENITLNALNMYGVIINKIKNKYNKKNKIYNLRY